VVKVLSLFSGSLASRVATRMVERHPQVESVFLLHFRSPFAREADEFRYLVKDEWSGVSFRTQSLKREYRRLVASAEDSTFSLVRSCAGCRALMLARAARYMVRIGADLIVTGEVLSGDGPSADDLGRITSSLGLESLVLRPLCAADGRGSRGSLRQWADDRLWSPGVDGANADRLLDLAAKLDLDPRDPMEACRRCKLRTDGFGQRAANLFAESGFNLNALRLLDFPLYYEVEPGTKVVLARTEEEKRELQNLLLPEDLRVYPSLRHGPMTLVRTDWRGLTGAQRRGVVELAARITATYVDASPCATIPIYYRLESSDETEFINVAPFSCPEQIAERADVRTVPLSLHEAAVAGA